MVRLKPGYWVRSNFWTLRARIRATGIGCFFDDEVHRILGIKDHSWQSLYHFTMGGAVEDQRIQSLDAYCHLPDNRRAASLRQAAPQ